MEFVAIAAVVALTKKLVDLSRYVTNRDLNGIVTQAWAWAVGIGVAALAAHAALTSDIAIGSTTLGNLDGASLIFAGVELASLASAVLVDVPKTIARLGGLPPLMPKAKPGP